MLIPVTNKVQFCCYSMKVKERKSDLDERKRQQEEKKLVLEEIKTEWNMMMTLRGNTQDDS